MLSLVKKAIFAGLLAALPSLAMSQAVDGGLSCQGEMFNPISDPDWNNMYPITIMGVSMGEGKNPPLMYVPPVCTCPGPFGIPSYGVGVTFWEPLYISEVERSPGCMSSLGATQILSGYASLHSEQISKANGDGQVSRMQVHWYEYPVMAALDMMKSYGCFSTSGTALMYITEIDPTWQSDEWAAVFSPEAVLFANPLAIASCSIDAVASAVGFPLDAMFWCSGTWGNVYPLSGNPGHTNSNFSSNNLVQSKFLARQARMGLAWQTIGPTATCFSHPNPIWLKSQFRVNQVAPIARKGSPVPVGAPGTFQYPPVTNMPTRESTVNLIWQGQQCCARLY